MKFAYLIFTHKNPDQLIRLLRRIDNDDALVNSDRFFARKLEPDSSIMDLLDNKVLNR